MLTMNKDFKFAYNADYNQHEATIYAKVVSLGEVNQTIEKTGTKYAVGAIEFTNADGEQKTVSAIAFEKNVEKGIKVGNTYLCNVIVTDDRPEEPIITISCLTNNVRATLTDFAFVPAEVNAGAEQTV